MTFLVIEDSFFFIEFFVRCCCRRCRWKDAAKEMFVYNQNFFVYLYLVKPQKTSYITTNIHTKSVIIFWGKSSGVKKLLSSAWYGLGWAGRGAESGVKINVAITPESRISSNIFLVT